MPQLKSGYFCLTVGLFCPACYHLGMNDAKPTPKRGRQTPSYSIIEAIGWIEEVDRKLGEGPFSRASISESLGHKALSGTANRKVGTLTHFGLLDKSGGRYSLSEAAKHILRSRSDAERLDAFGQSVRNPSVYKDLFARFEGRPVPELLNNLLARDFGIVPAQAGGVASLFIQSATEAGLLRNGVLHASPEKVSTKKADASGDTGPNVDPAGSPSREAASTIDGATDRDRDAACPDGFAEYSIPLDVTGRIATIRMPLPLKQCDVARIEAWAAFMKGLAHETP